MTSSFFASSCCCERTCHCLACLLNLSLTAEQQLPSFPCPVQFFTDQSQTRAAYFDYTKKEKRRRRRKIRQEMNPKSSTEEKKEEKERLSSSHFRWLVSRDWNVDQRAAAGIYSCSVRRRHHPTATAAATLAELQRLISFISSRYNEQNEQSEFPTTHRQTGMIPSVPFYCTYFLPRSCVHIFFGTVLGLSHPRLLDRLRASKRGILNLNFPFV